MSKVTAIVSTYNSEKFIKGCLDDLLGQTLYKRGELEILIINSNSLQNEEAVIFEYKNKFDHIKYIKTSYRESLYAAWNRAIKESSGIYITNANTDDRHRNDSMELLSNVLDLKNDISLVYSDCYVSRIENESYFDNNKKELYRFPDFFAPSCLLHYQFGPQAMWRKSIHDKIGFFCEDYKAASDYDFNIRVALEFKAWHVKQPLGLYLAHENAISFKDNTIGIETYHILSCYRNEDNIEKLYSNEGVDLHKRENLIQIYLDMGIRALAFYPPWAHGNASSDIEFAHYCFHKAALMDGANKEAQFNLRLVDNIMGNQDARKRFFMTNLIKLKFLIRGNNKINSYRYGKHVAYPSLLKFPSQLELISPS